MDFAANLAYGKALGRGIGGALLFSLPLLMTMEMWSLGFSIEKPRLLLLLVGSFPVLLGLSFFSGFENTFRLIDEVLDTCAALAIGFLLAAVALALFGALEGGHTLEESVGKVAICAIPAAMGALLAGKQLGAKAVAEARPKAQAGYLGEVFVMLVGCLFLAFNVAPTDEMALIAYQMSPVHSLLLIAVSVILLHIVVYELGFPGEDLRRSPRGTLHAILAFTAPGYGVALLVSAYALWTFGRLDGVSLHETSAMIVVLGFPAALGCATARLVI